MVGEHGLAGRLDRMITGGVPLHDHAVGMEDFHDFQRRETIGIEGGIFDLRAGINQYQQCIKAVTARGERGRKKCGTIPVYRRVDPFRMGLDQSPQFVHIIRLDGLFEKVDHLIFRGHAYAFLMY